MMRGSTPRAERLAGRQLASVLAAGPAGLAPKKKKPRAKRGTAAKMKNKIASYRRAQAAAASKRRSARIMPTLSPATAAYALMLNERKKAAARAALARRMRDPAFAQRYARKMLGRRYRTGGRLLGQQYKAPAHKRKPGPGGIPRTSRVQRGTGLKKYAGGKYANLIGINPSVVRMGDEFASKASLMDYAQLMRDKARAAYLRKTGKTTVRTPMTKEQKKAKRASAYRRKKAAMRAMANSPVTVVSNNSSAMSGVSDLSEVGSIAAQFSPPRPRTTRASTAAARSAAAAKRAASVRRSARLMR